MTGRWPNTDLREYEVIVNLTDDVDKVRELRPGLTAKIEILVNSRPDVLQVPVQSVVGVGTKHYAYVMMEDGPQQRELKIGESNETDIEIIDGIAEGEQVIMNPRTHFGGKNCGTGYPTWRRTERRDGSRDTARRDARVLRWKGAVPAKAVRVPAATALKRERAEEADSVVAAVVEETRLQHSPAWTATATVS